MRTIRVFTAAGLAAAALFLGGAAIASAATAPTSAPTAATLTAAPTNAAARAAYIVTAHELNIRSGPGTNYRRIGVLKHGDLIHANTTTVNGFRELRPGVWVSAAYLTPAGK